MKYGFFIFVSLFTFALSFYAALRGWQSLQQQPLWRNIYLGLSVVGYVALMSNFSVAHKLSPVFGQLVSGIGMSYFLFIVYMVMAFLLIDVVRISNSFLHFAPIGMQSFRLWAFVATTALVVMAMLYGSYRFHTPVLVELNIESAKPKHGKVLNVIAVSDLHLGVQINKSKLQQYVAAINQQKPDLILIAGDITDNSIRPLIEQNMSEELSQLKATYGVFAVNGNHEFYSEHPNATQELLEKSGITVLRDSAVLVDNSFYIVGRDDRTNAQRKDLASLTALLDTNKTMILLDHQPYALDEAMKNNIDLQISGHTHNGQFFPINFIVKRMYELAHGYLQKGNTHYYVSSGLGIWGPLYRIGTQSEIVKINFKI